MEEPLRIELEDAAAAEALRRALQEYGADLDESSCVRVPVSGRSAEQSVTEVLTAIDDWLVESGTAFVRVHLDGSTYTLNVPAS